MNKFFSSLPIFQSAGIAVVRIIVGLFLMFHGWEVFDKTKMLEYSNWELFKNSFSPLLLVYTGKAAELIAGFLLFFGLFTRVAAMIVIITFLYISFFVGHGKIWYDDQHPFLFVLLAIVFFVTGPGAASADSLLFKRDGKKLKITDE
ncbi:MAG: DoxX family protein [Ginsengibacter sp.]